MATTTSPRRSSFRSAVLIWLSSAALFFFLYRSAMIAAPSPSHSELSSVKEMRLQLYDKMSRDLDEKGPLFLKGGETSQSLSLSDIFQLKNGTVVPNLKVANPPVRANVLHLHPDFAKPISEVIKEIFLPYFEAEIWFQNESMYHFSMFHASHHLTPIIATETQIEDEANTVKKVSESICPLQIKLNRVILTSTGVLLGCWQVVSGTDPAEIRQKLKKALPNAPQKQLYDLVLLHTSFARILGQPKFIHEGSREPFDQLGFFHELVAKVNKKLHGFQARVSEMWYVEEYDVLALALNGKMKIRRFNLACNT